MAKCMKDGVELIKTLAGKGRGGSRPKSPKAVVRSASLEAPRSLADHKKAKRCLTAKTVAFAPAADTWARTTVLSNIWTIWAVSLVSAKSWKKASKTPRRLRRQKRFQTLFQLPNSIGKARQVMLCKVK